jgi:hypothetical protein
MAAKKKSRIKHKVSKKAGKAAAKKAPQKAPKKKTKQAATKAAKKTPKKATAKAANKKTAKKEAAKKSAVKKVARGQHASAPPATSGGKRAGTIPASVAISPGLVPAAGALGSEQVGGLGVGGNATPEEIASQIKTKFGFAPNRIVVFSELPKLWQLVDGAWHAIGLSTPESKKVAPARNDEVETVAPGSVHDGAVHNVETMATEAVGSVG